MDYREVAKVSVESLGAHKLRTTLTMLGVIFGVAAVIAMLSIGEGAKQEALEQISILGINNIIVNSKMLDEKAEAESGSQRSQGLSIADGENIARFSDLISNVVPQRFEAFNSVSYAGEQSPARVVATIPEFVQSSSIEVENGRFITAIDNEDFAQVCVLGSKTKRNLFAFDNPIGKSIRIGELEFTVIGVMADKYIGRGKVEGLELKNFNEDIYIPLKTAMKKFDRNAPASGLPGMVVFGDEDQEVGVIPDLDQLTITVRSLDRVAAVNKLVERILQRRHYGVPDYDIVVPESLLRQSQKTQRIFNIVMGAIAGLSLLVGGIGIMNIMLATVLERTREIGVRRAVGATQNDVLLQFLIEATMICLLGCTAGIVVGLLISRVIAFYAGWPTIVSLYSIILAVGVSTSVGLIFGLYPARKAARLDVIESLRYE